MPGSRLRVFVVWESVIVSDVAPPTNSKLSILHDARVAQCWDPHRAVSDDIVRAVLARPSHYEMSDGVDRHTVIWDMVAAFPPGVRWDADIPSPVYHGEPVIRAIPGLKQALSELLREN